ncbi:MAG: anhydro-N-acetylmuramic acid kinase [Candidatus Paracaedibacteraceae bacterium]|nr:anhydro-N-acetylmuramic acid kinase [Candidatus Paracaedibacteraceae bacterium]
MEPIWALGLMSGTSLDGIDAALILTDGEKIYELGESLYAPYDRDFQMQLRSQLGHQFPDPEVARQSTQRHCEVAQQLLEKTDRPVKLIGYHGQTTFHAPPLTVQMGDGQMLANVVGLPVVYDFRTADCAAGGQGAPLVPVYHQALCRDKSSPVVVINIGGVANLTYSDGESLIAGDTGPGNALINDVMERDFCQEFDQDGQTALKWEINQSLLQQWLQDPYFSKPFPKSLDRDHFSRLLKEAQGVEGIATLTALTAHSILKGIDMLPKPPQEILVCGGGVKNKTLMSLLGKKAAPLPESDMIEAQAFAFLAVRVLRGLPTSFPTTTGCRIPVCGGQLVGIKRREI